MKHVAEKIISRLKRDPSYKLDTSYSLRQLFFIFWYRLFQLIRGLFVKLKISSTGMIFCGKGVIIQHGYQIKAGASLILEENVHINALSEHGITCGNNVTIAKNSVIVCTGVVANKGIGINIGDNTAIGAQSFLGGQGGIDIGSNVIMGPHVKIFSENHNFSKLDIVIRKQGETRKKVVINDNCWIGAGATILNGVNIAEGCVVAAGSIVTKSIPKNSIVAGVPAKIIGSRQK